MATELQGDLFPLVQFQTKAIVPIRTFEPGVYTRKMIIQGNSILSTLLVTECDAGASVAVTYFDYGLGSDLGEKFYHPPHTTISAPNFVPPDRILITKIHDKPVCEITVTGGNVKLGIYVTVVASFASDLDSALVRDATTADLVSQKAIPIATYDQDQNKWYVLRSVGGVIPVAFSEAGDAVHLEAASTTTPGIAQDLISNTVPSGKVRKVTTAVVTSRTYGSYVVTINGDIIGSGRTGPGNTKDNITWNPRRNAQAGDLVKLTFTAHSDSPANDVEAYLMSSDI